MGRRRLRWSIRIRRRSGFYTSSRTSGRSAQSEHLPPQTVKDKFVTASEDSFDYSAFVLPALLAAECRGDEVDPGVWPWGRGLRPLYVAHLYRPDDREFHGGVYRSDDNARGHAVLHAGAWRVCEARRVCDEPGSSNAHRLRQTYVQLQRGRWRGDGRGDLELVLPAAGADCCQTR